MRLRVHHRTEYYYPEPVSSNANELRLSPLDTPHQRCESSFITILPAVALSHYRDFNFNTVNYFEVAVPHNRLVIETRSVVVTDHRVDYANLPYGFPHRELDELRIHSECHTFLQNSSYVEINPEAWRLALDIKGDSDDVFQTSYAIMEHIFRNFKYQPGSTSASTHANEVLQLKSGVCQDFAHAMVALCRSINIPARYVSGYFHDPGKDSGMRGSEASHAWVEVYILGHGWVALDPTNNKVIDDTYIVLARGRDYRDVAPVKGTYFGSSRSALSVKVSVDRLD
jgi:transglutaminase-like putative cysteine protease